MADFENITLQECENWNHRYEKGEFKYSEATPYNLEAMKRFIELRDKKGYQYVEDYTPGKWVAIDIKKYHSKYGTNYIYIDHERKLYRTSQTMGEFYGGGVVD